MQQQPENAGVSSDPGHIATGATVAGLILVIQALAQQSRVSPAVMPSLILSRNPAHRLNVSRRRVAASSRSRSTVTPSPGAAGTLSVLSGFSAKGGSIKSSL